MEIGIVIFGVGCWGVYLVCNFFNYFYFCVIVIVDFYLE